MKIFARVVLLFSMFSLALCAQSYQPGQLMLLVIGRSAAHPDADQSALLARVQALRATPGLGELKVATMHFDRSREAAFAKQVLGVSAAQLPAVCLVELDAAQLRPVRSLYCWPLVTGARLAQVDKMADTWTQLANVPLPLMTPQAAPPVSYSPAPTYPVPPVGYQSVPANYAAAPPSVGAAQPGPDAHNALLAGVNMPVNSWLRSSNGLYGCCFQGDGNLVVYRFDRTPPQPMWNSITNGRGGVNLRLSNDGVLRMFGPASQTVWQAGDSSAFSHCVLLMQDDGNLVIYRENGNGSYVAWASNSNQSH